MAAIQIKVISDAICPFCYLGKKRLERAIDVYRKTVPGAADDRISVSWLPFYLDPTSPKVGIPINERMKEKFGADRAVALRNNIRTMGAAEGINFTHEGKVGNTRDAHRLVQLAKKKEEAGAQGVQDAVVSSLFRSYFEEGGDITSPDMLVAAAERAGIPGPEARAWLASDNGGPEVDAEVGEAYARNVHGVPHFIISGAGEVSGAQDVDTFLNALTRARKAAA